MSIELQLWSGEASTTPSGLLGTSCAFCLLVNIQRYIFMEQQNMEKQPWEQPIREGGTFECFLGHKWPRAKVCKTEWSRTQTGSGRAIKKALNNGAPTVWAANPDPTVINVKQPTAQKNMTPYIQHISLWLHMSSLRERDGIYASSGGAISVRGTLHIWGMKYIYISISFLENHPISTYLGAQFVISITGAGSPPAHQTLKLETSSAPSQQAPTRDRNAYANAGKPVSYLLQGNNIKGSHLNSKSFMV